MDKLWNKIANFLSVKAWIALGLTAVYCYLAITGKIDSEAFENIFILVIGFYFGQSNGKASNQEKINQQKMLLNAIYGKVSNNKNNS